MFTGLIKEQGKLFQAEPVEGGLKLEIKTSSIEFLNKLSIGCSVALNGVCQTIERIYEHTFQVFSIPKTLNATNLNSLKIGEFVNLELPLKIIDRLDGHIVQGHVDTIARIQSISKHQKYWDIAILYQNPGIFEKASVALDGISLTVQKVSELGFSVQVIPETLKRTNIKYWKKNKNVNIEIDYLVKAVQNTSHFINIIAAKESRKN